MDRPNQGGREMLSFTQNSLSSLRTQGPITTGRSLWQQRWDGFLSNYEYHAVWVPAFAGTTLRLPFEICACLSAFAGTIEAQAIHQLR